MDLHGMTPERYIEILERTIRELKDQNELCTKRIAELLDERDKPAKTFPEHLLGSESETRWRENLGKPTRDYPGAVQMDRWQRDYK